MIQSRCDLYPQIAEVSYQEVLDFFILSYNRIIEQVPNADINHRETYYNWEMCVKIQLKIKLMEDYEQRKQNLTAGN